MRNIWGISIFMFSIFLMVGCGGDSSEDVVEEAVVVAATVVPTEEPTITASLTAAPPAEESPLRTATVVPVTEKPIATLPPPSSTAAPSAAATDTPLPISLIPLATANEDANVRACDGTDCERVGSVFKGEQAQILGRSESGTGWWYVELSDGTHGWVAPSTVDSNVEPQDVPPIVPIRTSTPTPTLTPVPTPTPFVNIEVYEVAIVTDPNPNGTPTPMPSPGIPGNLYIGGMGTVSCSSFCQDVNMTQFRLPTDVCLQWDEEGFQVGDVAITIEVFREEVLMASAQFAARGSGICRAARIQLNSEGNYTSVLSYGNIGQQKTWSVR